MKQIKEKKMNVKNFFLKDESELEDLGDGVGRKVIAYNDDMMCVEVYFERGAVGKLHTHPHRQITYILSGEFEFTIGSETKILVPGDSTYKQADIPHGVVCIKEGVLLDVFTPCRDDFLD